MNKRIIITSIVLFLAMGVLSNKIEQVQAEQDSDKRISTKFMKNKEDYLPSDWAKKSISSLKKLGVLEDSINYPYKKNITREEFCELLYKSYEKRNIIEGQITYTNTFVDTDNKSVLLLRELGIISGTSNNKFNPSEFITREQACVAISKLLTLLGQYEDEENKITFADYSRISPWAIEHVKNVASLEIIKGNQNKEFIPKGKLTFEQTMVIINSILDLKENAYYKSDEDQGVVLYGMKDKGFSEAVIDLVLEQGFYEYVTLSSCSNGEIGVNEQNVYNIDWDKIDLYSDNIISDYNEKIFEMNNEWYTANELMKFENITKDELNECINYARYLPVLRFDKGIRIFKVDNNCIIKLEDGFAMMIKEAGCYSDCNSYEIKENNQISLKEFEENFQYYPVDVEVKDNKITQIIIYYTP